MGGEEGEIRGVSFFFGLGGFFFFEGFSKVRLAEIVLS